MLGVLCLLIDLYITVSNMMNVIIKKYLEISIILLIDITFL